MAGAAWTTTASARKPAPTCCSTRTTRCIGRPGAPATLAAAKAADKPILLSIGYAACHWCHVMAHESFENPAIAALMNEQLRQHQGRPRGAPRSRRDLPECAGADGRAGRLAADDVPDARTASRSGAAPISRRAALGPARLSRRCWRRSPTPIATSATTSRRTSRRCARGCSGSASRSAATAAPEIARRCSTASPSGCCARSTRSMAASAPRPNSRNAASSNCCGAPGSAPASEPYRDAVLRTLTTICQGGIYDHLGGGYARYATDARWLVPHFEKMLYDNAELIEPADPGLAGDARPALLRSASPRRSAGSSARCCTPSGGFCQQPRCRQRARGRQILRLVRGRDRRACSATARAAVQALLRRDARRQLGRPQHPQPARPSRPRRRRDRGASWPPAANCCCAARAARVRPGLDDKVLADWNGLMIAALAEAGLGFERARLDRRSRARAFAFVGDADDRARRPAAPQLARGPGAPSGERRRLRQSLPRRAGAARGHRRDALSGAGARDWVAVLDRHYWDAAEGGYFFAADDTQDLIARVKTAYDAAVPSGNGTMVGVLTRLALLTGEEAIGGAPRRSSPPLPARWRAISSRSRP